MPVLSKKTLHLKERCLLLRGREFKTSIDQRGRVAQVGFDIG